MNYMTTSEILDNIRDERIAQDDKWGPQVRSWPEWVSILTEEVGEAAQAINLAYFDAIRTRADDLTRHELVQVAAVAVAMIEQIDNGEARVR